MSNHNAMDPLGSWTSELQNFILEIVQFAIKYPYASGNFAALKHKNIAVNPGNAKSSYFLEDKLRFSHQILHIFSSAFICSWQPELTYAPEILHMIMSSTTKWQAHLS